MDSLVLKILLVLGFMEWYKSVFSISDVCYVEIPATCQIRFSASVEVPSLMVDLHSGSS